MDLALAQQRASAAHAQATQLADLLEFATTEELGALLKEVQRTIKAVEAERATFTQPLAQLKKAVDKHFQPPIRTLESAKLVIKRRLAQAVEDSRREQMQALEQGDAKRALAVPEVKASTRIVKRWRVLDASAVPREYLCVDHAAVTAAINAGKKVAGVEVYEEVQVIAR